MGMCNSKMEKKAEKKGGKTLKHYQKKSKDVIKSKNSDVPVPVVFINETGAKKKIFWYSFDGGLTSRGTM